jgi:hypothetical protein
VTYSRILLNVRIASESNRNPFRCGRTFALAETFSPLSSWHKCNRNEPTATAQSMLRLLGVGLE